MALAAPMSAGNHRNHHRGPGEFDRHGRYEMNDGRHHRPHAEKRGHRHECRDARPERHRHHCKVGDVVRKRPPGGRYVMYGGRRHWEADGVIYRIMNSGRSAFYMAIGFSF